jgi:hypothetical protein
MFSRASLSYGWPVAAWGIGLLAGYPSRRRGGETGHTRLT